MKNYIVGYGSLINEESQKITGLASNSIPILLNGFRRSWTVTYDELQFCALGVYPDANKKITAVLFEVEDVEAFDKREHGYNRVPLEKSYLSPWFEKDQIPDDGNIWIYLPFQEKYGYASEKYFIWQSYIDVILMGCLSVDEKYAVQFLTETEEWKTEHFKNDRVESQYLPKLTKYTPDQIDLLIKNYLFKKEKE